jgi:formylglycine-generating enzyme required for sulfatase activity
MVFVEGGTFQMGATSEQGSESDDDEKPVHNVTLSDFCICKTEVTQALWQAVMGKNPSKFKGDDRPVEKVSWYDCQNFVEKLNAMTGANFRLPTEAEWENAAMGSYYGNTSIKYPTNVSPSYTSANCTMTTDFNFNGVIAAKLFQDYGSAYVVNYIKGDYAGESETLGECIQISKTGGVTNWANHGGSATKGYFLQTDLYATINADGGYTTPVGTYPANTLGLYDMAGNVSEWTSTSYNEALSHITSDMNPEYKYNAAKEDPYRMKRKIVRGGSWKDVSHYVRADLRMWEYQNEQRSYIGFRCVRTQVGFAKGRGK